MTASSAPQHSHSKKSHRRQEELRFGDIITLFFGYKWILLAAVGLVSSITIVDHLYFPVFLARSSITFYSSSNDPMQSMAAKMGATPAQKTSEDRYLLHLNSFEFFLDAADSFKKIPAEQRKQIFPKGMGSNEAIANSLKRSTAFTSGEADSVNIYATAPQVASSYHLANFIADNAVSALLAIEQREVDESEVYLRKQLSEREHSIKKIDSEIAQFKTNNRVFTMSGDKDGAAKRAMDLQREMSEADLEIAQNETTIQELSRELSKQDSRETVTNSNYKYGVPQKIVELRRRTVNLTRQKDASRKMLDDLYGSVDQHFEQQVMELRRKMELEYSLFESLYKQLFQNDVNRISIKNKVRLFEYARESSVVHRRTVSSKLFMAFLITFLTVGLGIYIWELSIPKIKDKSHLDDLGLVFLGGIPEHTTRFKGKTKAPQISATWRLGAESGISASFTRVRTRLLQFSEKFGETPQVLCLLSPLNGEGKSFVAQNLAACLSHMKKRTLLIDCDLRLASTSDLFKVGENKGLIEVLSAQAKFGDVVTSKVLPHLDILAAGVYREEITELLATDALHHLLADLKEVYDYIVLDTPSVLSVADSALISKQADALIMVAAQNQTTFKELSAGLDSILSTDSRRTYAILNRVRNVGDNLYLFAEGHAERRGIDRRAKPRSV